MVFPDGSIELICYNNDNGLNSNDDDSKNNNVYFDVRILAKKILKLR